MSDNYRKKIYASMQKAYGKSFFKLSEEDFNKKIESDDYIDIVHAKLQEAYPDQLTIDSKGFREALKKKDDPQVSSEVGASEIPSTEKIEGVSELKDTFSQAQNIKSKELLGNFDQRPVQEVYDLKETKPFYQEPQTFDLTSDIGAAVQKDRDNKGNRLGYFYNSILKGIGSQSAGITDLMAQVASQVPGAIPEGHTKDEYLKMIRSEMTPVVRESVKETLGADVGKNKQNKFEEEFVTSALGGLAASAPAMVSPMGSGLYLQAYDSGIESINSTEAGKNLPESTKTIFGAGVGAAQGALEKIGLDKIFGKQSTKAAQKLAIETLSDLIAKNAGKKITAEAFDIAVEQSAKTLKDKIIKSGGKIASAMGTEFVTGSLQEASTVLAEELINNNYGQVFEPSSWGDKIGRILYSGAQEAVGGGVLGVLSPSNTRNYIKEKVSSAQSPEDIQNLKQEVVSKITEGGLNAQEGADAVEFIDNYSKVYSSIPVDVINKPEAADKIMEREELTGNLQAKEEELKNVDVAFQPKVQEEVDALKGRIEEINEEISMVDQPVVEVKKETKRKKKSDGVKENIEEIKIDETVPADVVSENTAEVQNSRDGTKNDKGVVSNINQEEISRIADKIKSGEELTTTEVEFAQENEKVLKEMLREPEVGEVYDQIIDTGNDDGTVPGDRFVLGDADNVGRVDEKTPSQENAGVEQSTPVVEQAKGEEVEAKKADIEKRRQEGDNKDGSVYKSTTKEKNGLVITNYEAYNKEDGKKYSISGRKLTKEEFLSEYEVDEDYLDLLDGVELIVIREVRDNKGNLGITVRLRFKEGWIDAEIAALEAPVVSDKKADIERRRQEELYKTNLYEYDRKFKEFQTYGNTVKEAFDNLFEQVKNNPTNKKLSDLLDYINERLVPEDIQKGSGKNPLVQEYIDENQQSIEKASKSTKSTISKINAKYDAELAALEQSLPTQKENAGKEVGRGGDVETKQQIENFGVSKEDVEPVHSVISQVFSGLKKAGLTTAKSVGEWVGIGKGGVEKPYTLKMNGKDVQVKNTSPDVVNGFYSPLEKVITDTKFDKLPAKQWVEKYANSEEAKWTGLKDWLAQQQGSVSKADIQQFLKDNRIQVVEVVKGEVSNFTEDDIADVKINQHGAGNWVVKTKKDGTVEFPLDKADDKAEAIEYALEQLNYDNKSKRESKPKFQQYQIEGEKENYKEVLVTMPVAKSKQEYVVEQDYRTPNTFYAVNQKTGVKLKFGSYELAKSQAERLSKESQPDFDKQFKSSHFDEPNILVHLRMNTRVDSDGKRVLFLEEVQSDFAQAGRKQGFKLTEQEAGKAWEEADKEYAKFMKRMESKYGSEWESEMEKAEVEEETKLLDARENTKGGTIPQAPFVTDTNAWTKLGLKVALKEAVKQGADKIAWTTGEQQNDRYDLSKQVDYIQYEDAFGGRKYIDISTPTGLVTFKVESDGKIIENKNTPMTDAVGKNLADVIGKDIAERILSDKKSSGRLQGEGLKIGGKGMKGFYGSPTEGSLGIVGNVAKSLFKQEPKTTDIKVTEDKFVYDHHNTTIEETPKAYVLKDKDGNSLASFSKEVGSNYPPGQVRKQKLLEIARQNPDLREKVTGNSIQHSIDITPEMRKQVETEGQPLFKDAEAQYRVESGKNIIEAIKDFDGSPRATVALTHEIMHPTVVAIIDGAKEGNEVGSKHTKTIVDEFNKANPKNQVTVEDLIKGNDAFKNGTTSKQYRAVQEFIAKSWEKYHREGGKGFSEAFQKVLEQITQAFKQVYKSLTGKELTPELRKMFDEILGKEQSLSTQEAKAEQPLKETLTEKDEVKTESAKTPSEQKTGVVSDLGKTKENGDTPKPVTVSEKVTEEVGGGTKADTGEGNTGKEIEFFFAGSRKKGIVEKVNEDANLEVKSDGLNYTVKPHEVFKEGETFEDVIKRVDKKRKRVQEANEKVYEQVSGLRPRTETGRIPVSPLISDKKKDISKIIKDLTEGTKQQLRYGKTGRAGGFYRPSDSSIKIKYTGDLDITAHEIGHSLDDRHKVLENITPEVDNELSKFWDYGSKPKEGMSAAEKLNYKRGEGFAEWLRAFIVNPEEAITAAPELYNLYESKVSEGDKKAISNFSNDVREFAGSAGKDMVLANVQLEPKNENIISSILNKQKSSDFSITWADKLAANYINPMRAFQKAIEYAKGEQGISEDLLPNKNPELLARLFLGVQGKLTDAVENGIRKANTLEVIKDSEGNNKNLNWLLATLLNTDQATIEKEMSDVIAYMIAERTVELSNKLGSIDDDGNVISKESILTGIGGGIFKDLDIAKKTLKEFTDGDAEKLDRIKKAADRYRDFADEMLKYMVDKGRLSEDQYNKIKSSNTQYVALQRIIETAPEEEVTVFQKTSGALGSKKETVYKIKGSTKKIINPYVSLLDAYEKSIKEADRNDVLKQFRDLLVAERGMREGDTNRLSDIGVIAKKGDKNTIAIFVDGKPEYWQFQEDVYNYLKGLDKDTSKLPIYLTVIPKILRWTVTNFPVFAARNFVRDTQDRMIKSNENNLKNLGGLKDFVGKKTDYSELAQSGGLNAGYYFKDHSHYNGLMKEAIRELAKDKKVFIVDPVALKKIGGSYFNVLQTAETSNRIAEYRAAFRNAKEKGMDDYNASLYGAYRARDLMDFALMGNHMRIINQLVPFSNAAVRGIHRSVQSATTNPAGFALRLSLYSILPQALLWMLNNDDDEKEEEYNSLPAWRRDLFWNYPLGDNFWLAVPRPYELSLFAAGVDRSLSYFNGHKDAFDGYAGTVAKSLMPLSEDNIAGPVQLPVELIANYDFFRNKNIIPPSEEGTDLSLRNTGYASVLGQKVQDNLGLDARKADYLISHAFSYYGTSALKASNIGNEDLRDFDWSDAGFFRQTPAYDSKPVQDLMSFAKTWKLTKTPDYNEFNFLIKEYFNAKTDDEKEQAAKVLRKYAKDTLENWKKEMKEKEILQSQE